MSFNVLILPVPLSELKIKIFLTPPTGKFFMLFLISAVFFQSTFSKNYFRNTIRVSNSLVLSSTVRSITCMFTKTGNNNLGTGTFLYIICSFCYHKYNKDRRQC